MTASARRRDWTDDLARGTVPLGLVLAAALLIAAPPPARAAQPATCAIPAAAAASLPAAAVTPASPAPGTSVIQIEGEEATPASLPLATPAATPVAAAPDSRALLTEELTAVAESLTACLSEGDAEMVTELAGERYLGQLFGSSVPLSEADYLAIASELRPVPTRILAVEEAERPADDRATAVVTQVVGNQVMRAEWTFTPVPRGERPAGRSGWKLASERPLPVEAPRNASRIEVEIDHLAFSLSPTTVSGPDVVLHGQNVDAEDHEMLVLKLEDGYTTADLLRAAGPDLPEDVTFIGEMPVRAGSERDLVLVDLAPGAYTLVCLFPDAEGLPHLALGMEASFTVE